MIKRMLTYKTVFLGYFIIFLSLLLSTGVYKIHPILSLCCILFAIFIFYLIPKKNETKI